MRRVLLLAWLALLAPGGAVPLAAQAVQPGHTFPPPAAPTTSARAAGPVGSTGSVEMEGTAQRPLFTSRDALWISGFAAGALLAASFDDDIAGAARDSALQTTSWVSTPAAGLRVLGFPGTALITGGMYAYGRLTDRPGFADSGLHSSQAIVIATGLTIATKSIAGRARPSDSPHDPGDFELFRGFRADAYQSFPSAHATAAFATAAALTAEMGHHRPESKVATGIILFSTATLVGASRLYHDVHWASDVVTGAAIGTLTGWKVVQYAHQHPDNIFNRWFLGASVAPLPAGYVVRISIASPF